MTDSEIELAVLRRYIAQHEAGGLADPDGANKCARELDIREVIRDITGESGVELDYAAGLWYGRLAPEHPGSKGPLRQCSDSRINRGSHRYHARAFTDGTQAPAWNRVQELEALLPHALSTDRELEQKFRILYSPGQERRDFDTWTAQAARVGGYSIAVIFLDIDDFKQLNSAFTESAVDRTILPVFQRLVRGLCLHRGEAYRHGGEELVVLLPNCGLDEGGRFAEKLRGNVEAHEFQVDGQPVRLTVSLGVAVWPLHGASLEAVIEAANQAERSAKAEGKNRVHVATA